MDHVGQDLSCVDRYLEGWDEGVVFSAQVLHSLARYEVLDWQDQELDQAVYRVAFPLKPVDFAVRHAGKQLVPLLLFVLVLR